MTVNNEIIAKVAHEVNRAYCLFIGDSSQKSWEESPQWQKDSALNGVDFHMANDASPEQSHSNWMKEKIRDGWVYGDEKDEAKKTHPCLVQYEHLPKNQRVKDHLFSAVVNAFK